MENQNRWSLDFLNLIFQTKNDCGSKKLSNCSSDICRLNDFLLNFVLRHRQLVALEFSSFLPFRPYFGSEYLGEPFASNIILSVDVLVLVETQYIRVVRPVIPIFEHNLFC